MPKVAREVHLPATVRDDHSRARWPVEAPLTVKHSRFAGVERVSSHKAEARLRALPASRGPEAGARSRGRDWDHPGPTPGLRYAQLVGRRVEAIHDDQTSPGAAPAKGGPLGDVEVPVSDQVRPLCWGASGHVGVLRCPGKQPPGEVPRGGGLSATDVADQHQYTALSDVDAHLLAVGCHTDGYVHDERGNGADTSSDSLSAHFCTQGPSLVP